MLQNTMLRKTELQKMNPQKTDTTKKMVIDLQKKILRLNQYQDHRYERLYNGVYRGHINLLKILPILLHYNHPSLPCFTAHACFGIHKYHLKDKEQHLIQTLLKIKHTHWNETNNDMSQRPVIKGIYAMGSTGTMGQSLTSDIDLWLCIDPDLTVKQRQLLTLKCQRLQTWYKQSQIDICFFIMDENRFQQHLTDKLDNDHCGSSQHLLLLDEFYRSATFIAGLPLLWYIVPTNQEPNYQNYVEMLLATGQLNLDDWIDLGSLANIPASEYLGAAVWQLSKSIDSPYKSVIKIILLEVYAAQYPSGSLISSQIKQRALETEAFLTSDDYNSELDSYFLMYQNVADYLIKSNDYKRLDLVRRCLYLKTHEKLSNPSTMGSHTAYHDKKENGQWRRLLLQRMVQSWGWTADEMAYLDSRRHWKIIQVKNFHYELFDALMKTYHQLSDFAKKHQTTTMMNTQDMTNLFRKLFVAFDEHPGKIVLLNKQLSPDLGEKNISFVQVYETCGCLKGWYLYDAPLEPEAMIGKRVIMQSLDLSSLVSWCYFNGLITPSTKIYCHTSLKQQSNSNSNSIAHVAFAGASAEKINMFLKNLSAHFSDLLTGSTSINYMDHNALSRPCEIRKLALFVNLEKDPSAQLTEPDVKFSVAPGLIFNFGSNNLNLIGSIDFVFINSWGEIRTGGFKDDNAIIKTLQLLLNKIHQDATFPEFFDVYCYSKQMTSLIRSQIKSVFKECIELRLFSNQYKDNHRFKALHISGQTYGLFFKNRGVSIKKLENSVDFYKDISKSKLTNAILSSASLNENLTLMSILDRYASEGLLQFFFEDCLNGFNIYISDEYNNIEIFHECGLSKTAIVKKLNTYYRNNYFDCPSQSQSLSTRFHLPQYYLINFDDGKNNAAVLPFLSD